MAKGCRIFRSNENVLKLIVATYTQHCEYNKSQLWIFNGLNVWYVNNISIKLLKNKRSKIKYRKEMMKK